MKPALVQYFQEYADFHRHPTNRLTHKIAIPLIVFHIVAMLDWVKLFALPQAVGPITHLTLAHIAFVFAVIFYLNLHVRLGLIMAVAYAVCFPIGWVTPWPVVVAVAVFGWLIQLAGHSVWEKNRPAFLKNLFQALIGPMFFVAILTGDWPQRTHEAEAKA